jgi:DNA mismatch repair protein MutS2
VELQEREFAEVQRILGEFSARLRERSADLAEAAEILSEIDLAFAKAEFARAYDACLPEFVAGRELALSEVRHPLLEQVLRGQGKRPVPFSLTLAPPKIMVLVSGPNTGGKTVALKTLGLAALMAQAGLPVAAESAHLPLFERVLADIGDQQSIQASLSTFSAHVTNIRAMAEVAGANDLVLLDELGSSTEPNEGAALAISILEHFRSRGSISFVTTHHSRLKAYAAEAPEAVNAAMEFDEASLQPTFRLRVGLPGKSSALDIAGRLGLRSEIVDRARALLAPADAEAASLLTRLHAQQAELEQELARLKAERQALEARREKLEREFAEERRARLRELDRRLEETLRRADERWEKALAELRAQLEASRAGRRVERKAATLREEARQEWNAQVLETLGAPPEEEAPTVTKEPEVGDRVRVEGLSTSGVVAAKIGEAELEVEIGRLKMRIEKGRVRVLREAPRRAPAGPRAEVHAAEGEPAEVAAEINVIGATAEEARDRVDEFLDRAFVAGRFRLRIVHGHGKGILRKALHEFLASHPHVERFYAAPPREGGTGATLVELKI